METVDVRELLTEIRRAGHRAVEIVLDDIRTTAGVLVDARGDRRVFLVRHAPDRGLAACWGPADSMDDAVATLRAMGHRTRA